MRITTIRQRMQLSYLPEEAIKELFLLMWGIPDQTTLPGKVNNPVWVAVVTSMFEKYRWPMP